MTLSVLEGQSFQAFLSAIFHICGALRGPSASAELIVELPRILLLIRPGDVRRIVISMLVCLSVCSHNHKTELHEIFVHVAYGLVFLTQRCDTLTISCFKDDVISSYNDHMARYMYS